MTTTAELKCYVLMVAKNFPATHPRKGQPTAFAEKMRVRDKLHTIRANYPYWVKRINKINAGEACLSVREWEGKPYNSPQRELFKLRMVEIQKLDFTVLGWFVDGSDSDILTDDLARNDGLTPKDFRDWFKGYKMEDLAIIHFTDSFKY